MSREVTREEWLTRAVTELRILFGHANLTVPAVRVSVGWPGGRGKKDAVIGQCWSTHAAADETSQIFISPVLDNPLVVLATLVHELVHAVDDCRSGHRGDFVRFAKRVGLTGKMTATIAGDELALKLAGIADSLGEYPHAALTPSLAGGGAKQTTRYLKCQCPDCGYTVRVVKKWLDEYGEPVCPCAGVTADGVLQAGVRMERA